MAHTFTVVDGKQGLQQIQTLAKTKLEKVAGARIAFSLHGRRLIVRKVVQKAIQTVTAFKSIIGGVVSAEPHAALAWAGILTILPVRPTQSRLPSQVLLLGAEKVLVDARESIPAR